MKKLYSLLILLTLTMAGPNTMAAPRTGGQFQVSSTGTSWAGQSGFQPEAGDTIRTTGGSTPAVYIFNSGSFAVADGWNIEVSGIGAGTSGISVTGTSYFSGSNLNMITNDNFNSGVTSDQRSFISLVSSTIKLFGESAGLRAMNGGTINGTNLMVTTGGAINALNAHGIHIFNNGTVNVTDSEFVLTSASSGLVQIQGTGNNTATLTNVTANLASGSGLVLNTEYSSAATAITILNINDSTLTGNIQSNGNTRNTVNLALSSTLTGRSFRNSNSGLAVNIGNDSCWDVRGASNLNVLENSGVLDLRVASSLMVDRVTSGSGSSMAGNGNFTQLASGSTLLSLTGGVVSGAKLIVTGTAALAGTLDISLSNLDSAVGQTFALLSYGGRTGTFEEFLLNGVDVWQSGTAWTFEDVVISGYFVSGSVAYTANMLTLKITELEIIPEPGTWALILGGLGVLGYLQRARRKSAKA